MTRWTDAEDDQLKELAADGLSAREIALALDARSESAVSGRAARIGASLLSSPHQSLREYLADGGRIVREDVGGAVGIHWAKATRSGSNFAATICERFVALGFIEPTDGRENVFRWVRS